MCAINSTLLRGLEDHLLFRHPSPRLHYPVEQRPPGVGAVWVRYATHRVPGLSVVCEDVAPGMFQGVALLLGVSELPCPCNSFPPCR